MSDIAIHVEGLGKKYHIGGRQERYRTLRDTLTDAITAPIRRTKKLLRGEAYGAAELDETIWALRDLSFRVRHGEIIGVIGRNGAGKSTLLKVLSRITEPSEGYADVYGRIGALLEVSTGFHPELTGRENIFLNGAILGMAREEINRKFDAIVAFAEVEKFVDTPVKHYSSGMGLRLGFAVAAYLEPEILLIDEVLAVGDIEFQKKCLGKMDSIASEGRTVLFVSHNMSMIRSLCQRGVLLDSGSIIYDGEIGKTIQAYQQLQQKPAESIDSIQTFDFVDVYLNGKQNSVVDFSQPLTIDFVLVAREPVQAFRLMCLIDNIEGQHVVVTDTDHRHFPQLKNPGQYHIRLELPPLWLTPGAYSLLFHFRPSGSFGMKHRYLSSPILVDGISGQNIPIWKPVLCPDYQWKLDICPPIRDEVPYEC